MTILFIERIRGMARIILGMIIVRMGLRIVRLRSGWIMLMIGRIGCMSRRVIMRVVCISITRLRGLVWGLVGC